MSDGVFVTGTGTDVGKTYVAAALLRALTRRGLKTRALKPVASGVAPPTSPRFAANDTVRLLAAQNKAPTPDAVDTCTPWRFAAALSPDLAAAAEGRRLALADVVAFCQAHVADAPGLVLIEGAGGLMSPIARDGLNLDLATALGLPVLLVAGTYLGAVSHTLTALAVLRAHGLRVMGTVVNETPGAPTGVADTCALLARFAAPRGLAGAFTPLRRDEDCPPPLVDRLAAR